MGPKNIAFSISAWPDSVEKDGLQRLHTLGEALRYDRSP
jgi:hypothetical protein